VLNGVPGVGVAFDAEPGDEHDRRTARLAEGMRAVAADRSHDGSWHRPRHLVLG
jgi:hypothetical protein